MNDQYGIGKEEIDRMIELYNQGKTCGDVARIMEISSRALVHYYLKKHGVKIRKAAGKGKLVTSTDVTKWAQMYIDQELNIHEIAGACGVVSSTVLYSLKKSGIKMRPMMKREIFNAEQKQRIIADYNQGLSIEECSRIYKAATTTIHDILKKAGVDTKTNRMIKFRSKRDQQTIVSMYNAGWSLAGIGQELETSHDSIKAVLRLYNIPVKSFGELCGTEFIDRKNRKYFMKSSWEILYARWLDNQKIDWDYERETVDLGECKYIPDFWIYKDGKLDRIDEIKGWYTKRSKRKIVLFKRQNPNIRLCVLMQKHLENLGILKKKLNRQVNFLFH